MVMAQSYHIKAKVWLYQGKAAWHFITLPKKKSEQIRFVAFDSKSAWGSIRVTAKIGGTSWNTSIFPDTKSGAYLLPIKAEVRKKEKIEAGSIVAVTLEIGG
jgi:Domain of unknown function (DUF1905)